MTQDKIIEMARQAEKYADLQVSDTDIDIWERTVYLQFAKLIAAYECERIIEANKHEIERCNAYIKELENKLARGEA